MNNTLLILLILGLIGLAIYFYKLKKPAETGKPAETALTADQFLNNALLKELNMNYPALAFKLDGEKIISATGICVEARIYNNRKYDEGETFQINFFTTHKFFTTAIEERLVGKGETANAALQNGVTAFLIGQFPVIADALAMKHLPEMDFDVMGKNGKSHWHPIIGDIRLEGEFFNSQDTGFYEETYNRIKPLLETKLKSSNQSFHWFRYYIAKMPNGEIMGDCYFDNEPDEEGLAALQNLVSTWQTTKFAAQKQFIMFRHCNDLPE